MLDAPRGPSYSERTLGTPALSMELSALQITVNGEPLDVPPGTTIAQVVERMRLQPRFVAVERNLELVPRVRHGECVVEPGDRLEIVTLVGGG